MRYPPPLNPISYWATGLLAWLFLLTPFIFLATMLAILFLSS